MDISQEKQRLRDAIISAVRQGYTKVVEKAVEKTKEFEEKYNFIPPTPGDLLDFCHLEKLTPHLEQHYSPLMYACESSNLEMVKALLKSNASVAFTNKGGLNALHMACIKGNVRVVEALLEASVDQSQFCLKKGLPSDLHIALNARTKKDGWCPLLYAAKEGHTEVVRCLLERELASIKQASRDQEASTQQEQLNPILSCILITSKKKQNVLHIAAREKRLDCLKELHQYIPPASPETDSPLYLAIDKKAWNVLHHACAGGSVEVLKWLLKIFPTLNTAEFLNKRTKPGYTPLLIACQYQKTDVVKYLGTEEVAGVDFSACCADSEGADEEDGQKRMTGLHLAAIHDSPEIANLLIMKGCPVDTQDEKGETALHIAVRKASFDVADILRRTHEGERLKQIRNKDNQTPSDIQPEEVIPPEIKKRGKRAEELYRRALRKGKKRIPRCNLLVLGEQRVGKTSLIRLLTGKNFILELDPTRGIDNHVVETVVDMRPINIVKWKEVKQEDQARENDDLLVTGVVEEMGPLQPLSQQKQGAKKADKPVSEKVLLKIIDRIFSEMERMQEPEPEPEPEPDFYPHFAPPPPLYHFQPHEVPRQTYVRPLPQPRPPTAASIRKEDKPATSHPEPKPDKTTEPPVKARVVESHKATLQAADSSTELKETQIEVDKRLSRRHIHSINRELKSTSRSKKEPTLHLNTYDFAGQKEYRPMHHCFITRRSIYLVVFNLQNLADLIARGQKEGHSESLEEIRYWLNSIHAHIYSGSDDDKMKRVFLVGTHMSPKNLEQGKKITEEGLEQIHQLLEGTFYDDDHHNRFANHLQFPGLNNRIFAAIENSYDGPDERKASGAEALQQKLTETSKCFEFLKEEYPLLWLRFEAQLMRMREEKQQAKTSQVVKRSEVIQCAQQCGIIDQEEIDLALQFFHDTGTITCLEKLPTLFLGKMEKKQLADLVLLDPKWLITLMKLVMELKDGAAKYKGEDLKNLTKTGIARAALLCDCWQKYLTTDSDILFRQLCLMLQAYCLIYPIRGDIEPEIGCPDRSRSDNHETAPMASPPSLLHSQSDGSTDTAADDLNFLVPCKLPEKIEVKDHLPWITFHFDFQGFLPVEIFNRFMCLMLARSQAKSTKRRKHEFSATCCRFYQVEGCNWQVEGGVETDHMLKVSVIPPPKKERLDGYISMIHDEFLKKICDESDLKGLVYHGGPKVVCQRCKWSGVLPCVEYPDEIEYSTEVDCEECYHQYNIEELLRLQVQKTLKVNHGDRQLPAAIQSSTVSSSVQSTLDMKSIQTVLRELSEITHEWFNLGLALGLEYATLNGIETDKQTVDERKREMVRSWLQKKDGCTPSWQDLVKALGDDLVKRCDVAKQIKQKYI